MKKKIHIALYEPRMPPNVGAIMRTCACFDTNLYIIEPVGFQWRDPKFIRSKLDYKARINIIENFSIFLEQFQSYRKILFTPHTNIFVDDFEFKDNDILCFGRETDGIELQNMQYFQQLLAIKMPGNCRSLNLSVSVAIVLAKLNY